MQGNIAFNRYIKESGLSISELEQITDTDVNSLAAYREGKYSLEDVSVKRIRKIFSVLNINIIDFFERYYPYQDEVRQAVKKWEDEHKEEKEFLHVKGKLYLRIYQYKSRKRFTGGDIEHLMELYKQNIEKWGEFISMAGKNEEDGYNKYAAPIFVRIKELLNPPPEDAQRKILYDALVQSNLTSSTLINQDIAKIIGVSRRHLTNIYTNSDISLDSLKIKTALRLCELLEIDFYELFCEKNKIFS